MQHHILNWSHGRHGCAWLGTVVVPVAAAWDVAVETSGPKMPKKTPYCLKSIVSMASSWLKSWLGGKVQICWIMPKPLISCAFLHRMYIIFLHMFIHVSYILNILSKWTWPRVCEAEFSGPGRKVRTKPSTVGTMDLQVIHIEIKYTPPGK